MTAVSVSSITVSEASAQESAADLLNQMAVTPLRDRRRAALRDAAIEAWLPLARHLAHRYSGRGEPTDDLVQTAT
ncbi:RNA polymerase sigma factor SigF, partial [Actinoplanes sp. NPDC049118]